MADIKVNGVSYAYHRAGTGPPLLLLHGFTGSSKSWTEIIDHLQDRFHCVAVDLLGHGSSETPAAPERYAMPAAAQDLVDILTAFNLQPASVLGYSMGGRLALYLAINHPSRVSHLILESSSPGLDNTAERQARIMQDDALAERIEAEGVPPFVERWESLALFASQKEVAEDKKAELKARRLANQARGLANSLRGMGTGRQPNLWPQLASVKQPALLVVGDLDEKFKAINRQMLLSLPLATLVIVPEAGHNIHFEKPDLFARMTSTFLSNVLGSKGS